MFTIPVHCNECDKTSDVDVEDLQLEITDLVELVATYHKHMDSFDREALVQGFRDHGVLTQNPKKGI